MDRIDADSRALELLTPVTDLIKRAVETYPEGPRLTVCGGEVPGFSRLVGHTLVLSEALFGPDLCHPDEPTCVPPMDRWRRAAREVLQALALLILQDHAKRDWVGDWRWQGAASWMACRAAPDASLDAPDLALAVSTGDLGLHPASGLAVFRAWSALGEDPWERLWYVLGDGVVSCDEWLTIGQWVMSAEGLAGKLAVPVTRVPEVDIPLKCTPWSWRRIAVPPHARGGQVIVQGNAAVSVAWGVAGQTLHSLLAAVGECQVSAGVGGPVGRWRVTSAHAFGQVMGARGVSFDINASGDVQLVLADAFVGPLAALSVAEEVGTSGLSNGSWKVAGSQRISFHGIDGGALTMHARDADPFRMPARGVGIAAWLNALCDNAWGWHVQGPRLRLWGKMMGQDVDIRLEAT
jgi:hypothetical protein